MTDRQPEPEAENALPRLVEPVLIAAFEGWNDAGEAASTALEHLELSWDATPLAEIPSSKGPRTAMRHFKKSGKYPPARCFCSASRRRASSSRRAR